MKCRPATSADIPEMTRIITEGFLDYPFHIMLKPYLYQPERYPQCLAAVNRMLVRAYLRSRNALVVEHEGRVVAVALMHDRKVGFWETSSTAGMSSSVTRPPSSSSSLTKWRLGAIRSPSTWVISTGISRSCQWTVACAAKAWGDGSLPKCCRTLWQRGVAVPTASSHRRNPMRASTPTEAASSSMSSRFA